MIQVLFDKNHISAVTADKPKLQMMAFCINAAADTRFTKFVNGKDRLEIFYYSVIGQNAEFVDLFAVVRCIMTLKL